MYINLRNLEAISELPNKGEIMLTSNQIRRLQTTECWLREIRDSEEFRQLEYYPDVTLSDAIQAVGELLDEHEPYDSKPINYTNSDCVSSPMTASNRRFEGVYTGVNKKVSVYPES
jgi:hypothetical protein